MAATLKLSSEARAFVRNIEREYSITDVAGRRLLQIAGECIDRMRSAQQLIRQHGVLIQSRDGLRANPACQLERDARAHFLQTLKALNLDLEPLAGVGRPTKHQQHRSL